MATTAIATYTQFQAFAPTLSVVQTTIEPLLNRAHVWSQNAIANVPQANIAEARVQDAECQYVLCLLKELTTSSGATTGELKRKEVGRFAEEEYYHSSEGSSSSTQTLDDCYEAAWQFLYISGLDRPIFCAGVVR